MKPNPKTTTMKNILLRLSLVILCALALLPSASAADLAISPAAITNDFVGKVTLTITGLSAGQTVRVERFSDLNGNGVVDLATDGVTRSFTVTDGQLPVIGGVRNLNVPGDDDGAVNGTIRVDLDQPGIDNVFGTASGSFIYRVSDPLNVFAPVTRTFTVAQKGYSQGIRGRVTAAVGGAPLPGAFVVLLNANGNGIGGASADVNGNYSINTLPGSYQIYALLPGYIVDGALASATVVTNQFTTNNQALATGAFTISGRITDATSGAGLAGLFTFWNSTNNLFSLGGPTDTNGNYSVAVSASQWQAEGNGSGLAQLGYLRPDKLTTNITSASAANVNFSVPKATALIYGTVKDNLNNPVNGVQTRANDQANLYGASGTSLAPGANYTLGVLAGTWYANVESDNLPAGYLAPSSMNITLTAGQAVQANFVLRPVTARLLGRVVNLSGTPQSGLSIQAYPSNGGNGPQVVTAGDGSFDLGVIGGSWTIQLHSDNGAPSSLIGPNLTFNVTDGANINNINYVVLNVTGQITGILTNTAGSPLSDLNVYANVTINGTNYNQNTQTDAGGRFSLGVANGAWSVGVDSNGLISRGYSPANNQTVTISGANDVANFVALPPDTTPPSLSSSSPANGAAGVIGNAISFTFSEPMQSGFSINWNNVNANQFSFSWSGDQRTLICTYNTSFPTSTTIGWVLNPSAAGQSFRDLAGNALPSNVSGSFTTGSTPRGPTGTLFVPNSGTNKVMQFTINGVGSVFANTSSSSWALAFDSAGNVYVATPGDNSIRKFSPAGSDLGVFATLGSSGGQGPTGLAFDSAGNLYASDANDNTIKKFTPGGSRSVFANTGLLYPIGLAFDTAGNLYVANGNGNNIRKFSSTGTDLGVFASSGGASPYGLAFDSTGNLYVANNGSGGIVKITPAGSGSVFANPSGATPVGVAFDSAGNLYASYNNTVKKFSPAGAELGDFASAGLNGAMLIAIRIDPPPTLSIAPSGTQSVLFWPASGTNYILQSTTNMASPNWTAATDAVPVIAFTVTNTSPARFFRLVQP